MVESPPLGGAWGGKLLLITTIPSKRTNEVFIMFKYYIHNNERYPEDRDVIELISTEKLSFSEFKNLVQKAFELCGGEDVHYTQIAEKIEEIDERFIKSEPQAIAYVGMEEGDYMDKIRGFHEIKRR